MMKRSTSSGSMSGDGCEGSFCNVNSACSQSVSSWSSNSLSLLLLLQVLSLLEEEDAGLLLNMLFVSVVHGA